MSLNTASPVRLHNKRPAAVKQTIAPPRSARLRRDGFVPACDPSAVVPMPVSANPMNPCFETLAGFPAHDTTLAGHPSPTPYRKPAVDPKSGGASHAVKRIRFT